jgi:PAS domain S-box-containing protein
MKTIDDLKRETELPVLLTDEQGLIIYVNDCFREIFGWQGDEILGETLEAVIPSSYHDSHHLGFSRFIMTGMPTILNHPLQLKAVTKDGQEIYSEHFIIAEEYEGHWVLGATLRPINEP